MNKRYIYIIIIISILIAICIAEQLLVNGYLSTMETKITDIIEYVGDSETIDTPEIYDMIVNLETEWDSYEGVLCFLVNLKDIEDIGIELTKMKIFIVEDSAIDFKASLSLLLYYIDGYYNLMGISFENIF
ncbi:MAG: DUF4363 family protein [Candidatus ainarchaeum sp.]|nr:DUF4363 family protein [Candidatus ainarchaeum sp.]